MATFSFSSSKKGAFYLKIEGLQRLIQQIGRYVGKDAKYEINIESSFSYSGEGGGDLNDIPYLGSSYPTRLNIRGGGKRDDAIRHVTVSVVQRSHHAELEYSIQSEVDDIQALKGDIELFINESETYYSWFVRIPGLAWQIAFLLGGLWLSLALLPDPLSRVFVAPGKVLSEGERSSLLSIAMTLGFFVSILLLVISSRIKNYVCPTLAIAAGLSKARYEHRIDAQRRLIWIPIALVAGLALTWLLG